jgi:exopolyphosphatase/guanosine-5'-triphosphate,3'-diphosphate pyrophosphatase
MVVFEGGRRCPATLFNEKVLCGLGADLARTGRLSPEGCERALAALRRFVALAPGLNLSALAGVATAAVRDATDGEAFRERVAEETNIRLEIASGGDEARLAAQGVLFGDPSAAGLVVDLGGASMELCPVNLQGPGLGVSTALGPQRLGDLSDQQSVRAVIGQTLEPLARRFVGSGHRIYLVGGAWRAFGRVMIERAEHPFDILHEFSFTPEQAGPVTDELLGMDREALSQFSTVPSGRVATLPHAALLLQGLIQSFGPDQIVISGFGLREGICYDNLSKELRAQDPLLSTALGHERTRARSPGFGAELAEWIFGALDPADEREARLIRAACHLADVSWRAHPDYRGTACREVVTRVNLSSAGHDGRAFLLAALLSRYKGSRRTLEAEPAIRLLSPEVVGRARLLGALMRLGVSLAGAMRGYLRHSPLSVEDGVLTLSPSPEARVFVGEEVVKRLTQAARLMAVEARVATDP